MATSGRITRKEDEDELGESPMGDKEIWDGEPRRCDPPWAGHGATGGHKDTKPDRGSPTGPGAGEGGGPERATKIALLPPGGWTGPSSGPMGDSIGTGRGQTPPGSMDRRASNVAR